MISAAKRKGKGNSFAGLITNWKVEIDIEICEVAVGGPIDTLRIKIGSTKIFLTSFHFGFPLYSSEHHYRKTIKYFSNCISNGHDEKI